jgi:hypothetical protein
MAEQLVKLTNPNARDGEPSTADVHPDEVQSYAEAGWVAEEAEVATTKKAKKKE